MKTTNCGKPGEYGKDFMKIKFNSHNVPLNKILKLHNFNNSYTICFLRIQQI